MVQYRALVADYDGTLAEDGRVDDATLDAIERLRAAGVRFVLVTGREVEDLLEVFSRASICDRIVAENGALLLRHHAREVRMLTGSPNPRFVASLRMRKVTPLSVGRAIVATRAPHERTVRAVIRDLGLSLSVSLNKGAVMVLPRGVDKGSGVRAALRDLGVAPIDAIAIGDAQNDEPLMRACGLRTAVGNALERVKERADVVTSGEHGAGVVEIVDRLLAGELPAPPRRGRRASGSL